MGELMRHTLLLLALAGCGETWTWGDTDPQDSAIGHDSADTGNSAAGSDTDSGDTGPDTSDTGDDADRDGYTEAEGDCDDSDPDVRPSAEEDCGDGVDNDCDGTSNGCGIPDLDVAGAGVRFPGAPDDAFGQCVVIIGDCNGDGLRELVISDPARDGLLGVVQVFLGGRTPSESPATTVYGGDAEGYFGMVCASAGDIDHDGQDDLAVASETYGEQQAGAVFIYSGGADLLSATSVSDALVTYTGAWPSSYLGSAVAGGADVNGDGVDDLLIGAEVDNDQLGRGAAYLVLGSELPVSQALGNADADVQFAGVVDAEYAGRSTALGDLDGDGLADLVVGGRGGADFPGVTYVVLGTGAPESMSLDMADVAVRGEAPEDLAGLALAAVGDANGDGFHDLLIGALGSDTSGSKAGAAYFLAGGTTIGDGSASLAAATARYDGEAPGDEAGYSVSDAGDSDGDGFNDFLVGAYRSDEGGDSAGAVYLILGSSAPASASLGDANARLLGPSGSATGSALSGGDVDADGYSDILVGAPGGVTGVEGSAYLVFGQGL